MLHFSPVCCLPQVSEKNRKGKIDTVPNPQGVLIEYVKYLLCPAKLSVL